jgi:hypothetical protein
MDFETIMLGLLAVAVFLVPIFYIQRKQKGQANKVEQVFLEASQKQGLNLSKYDFWNEQYGIGLDEVNNKLYYWNNTAQDPQEVLVDVHSIQEKCSGQHVPGGEQEPRHRHDRASPGAARGKVAGAVPDILQQGWQHDAERRTGAGLQVGQHPEE